MEAKDYTGVMHGPTCIILHCDYPRHGGSAWCDVHSIFAKSEHAPRIEDVDPVRYAEVKARVDARDARDREERRRDHLRFLHRRYGLDFRDWL